MLAYGEDVLKRTIEHMTRFDPEWKVPEGFFPDLRENGDKSCAEEEMDGTNRHRNLQQDSRDTVIQHV